MREEHRNPIFGRKIFFLNPAQIIESVVLPKLQELEYEIYIIKDHHYAKPIMLHYPDAILYINIDQQLSLDQWYNFIKSFKNSAVLSTIIVGIVSERSDKSVRNKFLLNAELPGGFISANSPTMDLVERLKGVFEINGAKGRRQYVRALCGGSDAAILRMNVGLKLFNVQVLDISAVGISCICRERLPVKAHTVIHDASIFIGQQRITCDLILFATKKGSGGDTLILLFAQSTPDEIRESVRAFVCRTLQRQLGRMAERCRPDATDYSLSQSADIFIDPDAPFLPQEP